MTGVEQVYGGALYELAQKEQLTDLLLSQLQQVLEIWKEYPDYRRLLSNLSISRAERCQLLDEAFREQIHPYLLNFMKILCENGTIGQLEGCAEEYRRRYNADHDIVEVCAVTAVELGEELRRLLLDKLQKTMGKTVQLQFRTDPSCMGGMRLELPGRQLDGTVKNRLDVLSRQLQAVI